MDDLYNYKFKLKDKLNFSWCAYVNRCSMDFIMTCRLPIHHYKCLEIINKYISSRLELLVILKFEIYLVLLMCFHYLVVNHLCIKLELFMCIYNGIIMKFKIFLQNTVIYVWKKLPESISFNIKVYNIYMQYLKSNNVRLSIHVFFIWIVYL